MASSEHADDLATCPKCGESAMSGDTPCSRCQEPNGVDVEPGEDRCHNCGSHVSSQWARVFGDNQHQVHSCPECAPSTEHFHGAAAGLDHATTRVVQR